MSLLRPLRLLNRTFLSYSFKNISVTKLLSSRSDCKSALIREAIKQKLRMTKEVEDENKTVSVGTQCGNTPYSEDIVVLSCCLSPVRDNNDDVVPDDSSETNEMMRNSRNCSE